MDTFDKRSQLGASRRRFEDAQILNSHKRWTGSIYLAGYAIECSLKSLICFEENKNNFKDTNIFQKGLQASSLHNERNIIGGFAYNTTCYTIRPDW